MFDEIELTNCPEKYALNCKNYETKCHECKANSKGKYLQYRPIINSINVHPCSIKKKKKGVSYSRKGRKEERKMIVDSNYLISNYISGALAGDGDAHINLTNIGKIRVEIKCRFTINGKKYPSAKEYRESKNQKVQIILVNKTKFLNEIFAYMNFKLFIKMWREILWHKNIKWVSSKYKFAEHYEFYKVRKKVPHYPIESSSFVLGEESKSPINIFKDPTIKYSRIIIYIRQEGQYVMMHQDTLNKLIDLYEYLTIEK